MRRLARVSCSNPRTARMQMLAFIGQESHPVLFKEPRAMIECDNKPGDPYGYPALCSCEPALAVSTIQIPAESRAGSLLIIA